MYDKENTKGGVDYIMNWRAWIPKWAPNRLVCGVMSLMGVLYRTSEKDIARNREHNTRLLVVEEHSAATASFFQPGTYIENQRSWNKVCFGSQYTMSYDGCEIIAVYNAGLSLGEKRSGQDMVDLITQFERRGAVWAGKFGGAPRAAYSYFRKKGYDVCIRFRRKEALINALGEEYDTMIVTAYNNKEDIFSCIHTVNFSKEKDGCFWGHNCYRQGKDKSFISDGPYATLWEAIHRMGKGRSVPICVIGIRKKKEL